MAVNNSSMSRSPTRTPEFSGRARAALSQHQRRVIELHRDMQVADRVLSGALAACDGNSQHEMLSAYLETVQELRVGLQRLEGFLLQRVGNGSSMTPEVLDSIEYELDAQATGRAD